MSGRRGSSDRVAPLTNSRLFADMDLLARPDEANDHAPLRDTLCELNEVLWFRLAIALAAMRCGYLRCVERSLSLIENEHMFRWD